MASFLDGMAGSIYAGFKGKLRKGVIRQKTGGGGLDSHGRPLAAEYGMFACQGFVDDYSEITRAQAGIPATDLRVNLFGASILPRVPTKDDLVRIDEPSGSRWFKLRAVATDPAKALYVCQAYLTAAP